MNERFFLLFVPLVVCDYVNPDNEVKREVTRIENVPITQETTLTYPKMSE